MSRVAWVMKEWTSRTVPSTLCRSIWVTFLKASMSVLKKRARFSLFLWVTSFIIINGLLDPLGHSLQ